MTSPKVETGKVSKNEKQLRAFAQVWNDHRGFPQNIDLERHLGKSIRSIQARVRRYTKYRLDNLDAGLPELIWRRAVTGGVIPVPQSVISQLDEFRFDVDFLKGKKGIVVTSAQFGASLNKRFWETLKVYADYRDFPLLVMPIKYGAVRTRKTKEGGRILTSTFPEELKGHMVFEDLSLCKNELMLNVVRMRPTLERFLTQKICEMGKKVSQIVAAPKLELEHRPRIGHKYPKAIMTTGACTIPSYNVDNLGQQDRTGEVAIANHTYAAIVVEFVGGYFHFRQLLSSKRGEFYDISPKGGGLYFTPTGVEHRPNDVEALILGDWHTGKTCPDVRKGTFDKDGMVDTLKPNHIVLHDFVDCDSVSHWEQMQGARRAYKAPLRRDSLQLELQEAVTELRWMQARTDAQLHVVASNHNEYVTEYIEKLQWVKDDANLEIGARLFLAMIDDLKRRTPPKHEVSPVDPVVWWFRQHCPNVKSHERQDALLLPANSKRAILCTMHGDIGTKGGRTRSDTEFAKMNQRIFLGHNHSATILSPTWRVGTSTPRMQFYVNNPATNWTNTHGVIFKNAQRQLLTFIHGKWHG